MDPFSRKLFRNSDARQKLAQMGGIVASSPQLASTVQRFQDGGDVMGHPGEAGANFHAPSGMMYSELDDMRLNMVANTGDPVARAAAAAELNRRMSMTAPPTGPSTPSLQGIRNNLAAAASDPNLSDNERTALQTQQSVLEAAVSTGAGVADAVTDAIALLNRIGTVPFRGVGHAVSVVSPSAGASIFDLADRFDAGSDALARFGQRDPADAIEQAAREDAEAAAAAREEAGITESLRTPEDVAQAIQEARSPSEELMAAEPEPDPEPTPPPETDTETEDPLTSVGDQMANDLRTFFGVEPPSRDPRNRRERIEQELQLIKDVFGDKTKDESRERAMNLAMIGLAIAAGQSPNALTNIAQGALAGTQAMQRAQAAAAEREDALRMQAFETVLAEDQRAQDLSDRMGLERFKAGLAGPKDPTRIGTSPSPLTGFYQAQAAIDARLSDPMGGNWEPGKNVNVQAAEARVEALNRQYELWAQTQDPQARQELQQMINMGVRNYPKSTMHIVAREVEKYRAENVPEQEIARRLRIDGHQPELYGVRP